VVYFEQDAVFSSGASAQALARSANFSVADETGWGLDGSGKSWLFGEVTIGADLVSSNWDGAADPTLPDTDATEGYYLDYSAGAAQFQNIYAKGGELDTLSVTGQITLSATGSLYTRASGAHIRLGGTTLLVFEGTSTQVGSIGTITGTFKIWTEAGKALVLDSTEISLGKAASTDISINDTAGRISVEADDINIIAGDALQLDGTSVRVLTDLIVNGGDILDSSSSVRLHWTSTFTQLYGPDGNSKFWAGNTQMFLNGDDIFFRSAGSTTRYVMDGAGLRPFANNTYTLGGSGKTWSQIWATLGTGTATMDVNINATTKQLYRVTSSRRYKKRIKYGDVPGLDFITSLRPASFYWRKGHTENATEGKDIGLIAEDVEEVAPLFVPKDEKGRPDAVSYSKLVIPLVASVQELTRDNAELRSMLQSMHEQIIELQRCAGSP
jgi:hypothetical protein